MSSYEEKRNFSRSYIRQLVEIENNMEVYKEQKRDLRNHFREEGWLTTHEIAATVRAWRIVVAANKGHVDLDDLFEQVEMFSEATRGPDPIMSTTENSNTGEPAA